MILAPALYSQAPKAPEQLAKPAAEYNFTFCGPSALGQMHFVLSPDKKVLDAAYYRDGDQVVKDDSTDGSHLVFSIDQFEEQENHFIKIHGVTSAPAPEPNAPPIKIEIVAQQFGKRIAGMVFISGHLRYAVYGYVGSVDELVKLDGEAEAQTCGEFLQGGGDALPKNLINWLKFGKVSDEAPGDKT